MANCRISVANLAWSTVSTETGEVRSIAIQRPGVTINGKPIWGALGGAAMLTLEGKTWLESAFAAEQFTPDKSTGFYDMRFVVDETHIEQILHIFAKPTVCEHDPTLDIMHELAEFTWDGHPSLLSLAECSKVRCVYDKSARQRLADPKQDTSRRAIGLPTHRLFRTFMLHMSDELLSKLYTHPMICELTRSELATTNGGSSMGERKNGDQIANNLFILP